jgi:hypothetical protein
MTVPLIERFPRPEQLGNVLQTTLSASISTTTRPVTVTPTSTVGWPTTPGFRIAIEDELLLVTYVANNALTWLAETVEGTTAATHAAGTPVAQVYTAATVQQMIYDHQGSGSPTADPHPMYQRRQDLGLNTLNVRARGAAGNGVTDDTAAIQAVLDSVDPTAGAVVLFPAGTFMISAALSLKSNTRLVGMGKTTTIIQATGYGYPAIDLYNVDDCTVESMGLLYTGPRANLLGSVRADAQYAYGAGIYSNGSRHVMRALKISGFGMGITLSNYVTAGASLSGTPSRNFVSDVVIERVDHGVLVYGQKQLTIDRVWVTAQEDSSAGGNPLHALYCTNFGVTTGLLVSNLYNRDNPTGAVLQIKNSSGGVFSNIYADNTSGVINVQNADRLVFTGVTALNQIPVGSGTDVITFQNVAESYNRIENVLITMGNNKKAVSLYGSDNTIDGLTILVDRTGGSQDAYDIVLDGSNNTLRNTNIVGNAAFIGRAIMVNGGVNHVITDVRSRNVRTTVDVLGGTGSKVVVDRSVTGADTGSGFVAVNNAAGSTNFIGLTTTANRSTAAAAGIGAMGYDTTQSKPIWSDGTNWRDADAISTVQTPAFAASYTPDPFAGQFIEMTLTGAITVNAPASAYNGQQVTFIFIQDATGGRVVTWNAVYRVNWTPTTTAAKRNTITFVYDGSIWNQTATGLNL